MAIRPEVLAFSAMGPLPAEGDATEDGLERFHQHLKQIPEPVTDEEAELLLRSFGEDDGYGLAWKLLHLVETAPSCPVRTEPSPGANEWLDRLWRSAKNARRS